MTDSPSHSGTGSASGDQTHALFGQTMGYVAATAGLFALGAYLGRHLPYGWAFVGFIAAFVCLIGMNFAVRRSESLSAGLLFAVGLLLGLAHPGQQGDPIIACVLEPGYPRQLPGAAQLEAR